MPAAKPPVIARIGYGELIERMQDLAGVTRESAVESLRCVTLALGTWLEGMANALPHGTEAQCRLSGLGTFRVTYFKPYVHPRAKISRWKRLSKIPERPPKLTILFEPYDLIARVIAKENRLIGKQYAIDSAPARAAARESYLREHEAYLRRKALRLRARLPEGHHHDDVAPQPANQTSGQETQQPDDL